MGCIDSYVRFLDRAVRRPQNPPTMIRLALVLAAAVLLQEGKAAEELRKLEQERKARAEANRKVNDELAGKLAKLLEKKTVSGFVRVVKDGRPLFNAGFGMADREAKRPNVENTLYDLGSVTKPFTAAAVLRLEAAGKLKISDPLSKFVKDAPADKASITVAQLLSHTGGIDRMYDFEGVDTSKRDTVVSHLLNVPLVAKPGEKHNYSNANYFLLAAIVEIAAGRPFEEIVREQVFKPCGMADSGFTGEGGLDKKRAAVRYEDGAARGTSVQSGYSWSFRGATGLITTPLDLIRFGDALRTGALLDAKARERFFKVVEGGYSLGWYVMEATRGSVKICHSGAAIGARCYYAFFPKEDIAYAIFLNESVRGSLIEFTLAREIEGVLLSR